MQVTHSRKYRERLADFPPSTTAKASTKSDAAAWGRVAAVLNWGLSDLAEEVEPELHEVARAAYNRKMLKLHGAPF